MPSAINIAIPADNVQVKKSDIRDNFATAASEITALQAGVASIQSKVTILRLIGYDISTPLGL